MRYEVRVKKIIYDFYNVEAKDAEHAKKQAMHLKKVGKTDTIRMKPNIDYVTEVCNGNV